jgi:hypothetical protein
MPSGWFLRWAVAGPSQRKPQHSDLKASVSGHGHILCFVEDNAAGLSGWAVASPSQQMERL